MSRELTQRSQTSTGPVPYSDGFEGGSTSGEGSVDVIHGVHIHSFPLAGMTIGQARDEMSELMGIDPTAVAVVDGEEADEEAVIHEGQVLTFVKPAGEKGAGWRRGYLVPPALTTTR